jgi:hypothetical protein
MCKTLASRQHWAPGGWADGQRTPTWQERVPNVVPPAQAQRERERAQRRVNEAVEPELMARAMLRPEDDDIRAVDLPERLQMAPVPLPDDPDWHACARCARALGK